MSLKHIYLTLLFKTFLLYVTINKVRLIRTVFYKKKKKKKALYSRVTKSQYKVAPPCVLRVSGDHWTENLVLVSSDK